MSIRDELQEMLERDIESEMELGNLLFRGVNLPCQPLHQNLGMAMGSFGPPVSSSEMDFTIRRNAYETITGDSGIGPTGDSDNPADSGDNNLIWPTAGQIIRYMQRDWEVEGVPVLDSTGAYWRVHCVDPNS